MSLQNNTFDFAIPSRETTVEFTPNLYSVQFGGRYKQVTAAGINNVAGKWTAVFNTISRLTLYNIDVFLRAHSDGSAFLWVPPPPYDGPDGATKIQVRCVDPWKPSWQPGGLICDISLTFEQV